MLARWHQVESVLEKARAAHHGSPRSLARASRVTVLLFFLASGTTPRAEGGKGSGFRVFEFRCEFRVPPAPGRVHGLMASDDRQRRIAIYWMEPALFREAPSFLRCCDLIFDHDVVHYWIQGMSQPGRFHLSDGQKEPLLPAQKSPESILRSALAIVSQIRCPRDGRDTPLEFATFFETSRGQARYQHEVLPGKTGPRPSAHDSISDAQALNTLPFGRQYSKETRDDGCMVWRAQKVATGSPVVTVTIQGVHEFGQEAARGAFDVRTLGQWRLVREAHRDYWSFARDIETMSVSSEVGRSARDLYGRLNSYLDQNDVPPEVGRALDRLGFQAALMTADSNCVWQSAQAMITGLCADETLPKQECVMELGSMSGRIQEQCPAQMAERLRPLVAQVVRHAGQDAATGVKRLMVDIMNNAWFTYGELFVSEMGRVGLMDQRDADSWTARLEASRRARGGSGSDPCDATPTVQRYLAQLDTDPPKGALDMNDIRRILNEGLAKRYTADQSETRREVVESTIRSIRLIGGEGPFRGDPDGLIASIDRFSRHCLVVDQSTEPFDTVLATFLALSFCDTSTPDDHKLLFSQLQHCSAELQGQVHTMLAGCGLAALVTPEDVRRTFGIYERIFRRYVDDPLGPAFKFPWTHSEEARLDGRLRLRLLQLEPLLDEIAVKVKYGGVSAELKDRAVGEISKAAQELLPQAAFLRMPPYPGVSCQYHAGYGFSVVIKGPLYQEGNRPKEKFKAMRYFHLGHRLQKIVEHERELALHPEKKETTK